MKRSNGVPDERTLGLFEVAHPVAVILSYYRYDVGRACGYGVAPADGAADGAADDVPAGVAEGVAEAGGDGVADGTTAQAGTDFTATPRCS
jgi:hypothetical protein